MPETNSASPLPDFSPAPARLERPSISGKFFRLGPETFYVKGVTYGTFAPRLDGSQYPGPERVAMDFAQMRAHGINTVRLYTPPRADMLDQAVRHGLRLMVGLPWTQHVAFLEDGRLARQIRDEVVSQVRALGQHPAVLLFALGNEIPPPVVRWHGQAKVERFLRELVDAARQASPESLFTYVNYPPTEFLELDAFDVAAFNVYLHDPIKLRAYLARLQNLAGNKPLLLAEAGADSIREGEQGQADLTAMHLRAAFQEGLCGAFAYAWTDEWWRGGQDVDDWAFGLVDAQRQPKPALAAVTRAFAEAPFPESEKRWWPKVSVVVCAYNASDTLEDCLSSLATLNYPDYEVVLVNDGSKDATPEIARRYPGVRTVDVYPNGGLSNARNVGLAHARGEIVAYTDADVRVDPEWLTYLVQPFLNSDVVGSGGPNVVPADDPWIAQSVARAPGGPTHVLLDDRTAEHVPGCNMAFRKQALEAIGGFNPIYLRAGDDVDVCWRLQARGGKIGFAPAALVWHHHRASVKAYWRQQLGYGEGELWLVPNHPDKFVGGQALWHGRIYSPLPFVRSLTRARVNAGIWGTAPFPSVYHVGAPARDYLPHTLGWQASAVGLLAAGLLGLLSPWPSLFALLLLSGAGLLGVTLARCVRYALRTELRGLPPLPGLTPGQTRFRYRAMIAWLHFLQPLARLRGRLRALLNPPSFPVPEAERTQPPRRALPSLGETMATLRLLSGGTLGARYWGETWTSVERVLDGVVKELRSSRAVRTILIDDGWNQDRDVSVALGPWARLDLRALLEEHAQGRVLLRAATRVRLTGLGRAVLAGLALLGAGLGSGVVSGRPVAGILLAAGLATAAGAAFARLLVAGTAVSRAVARTAAVQGMISLDAAPAAARRREGLAWGLRAAVALALASVASTARVPAVPASAARAAQSAAVRVQTAPGVERSQRATPQIGAPRVVPVLVSARGTRPAAPLARPANPRRSRSSL